MLNVFAKIVLLISVFDSGTAIRCYICQSRSNPACLDPIRLYQLELTECTPEVLRYSSKELARGFNGIRGMDTHQATELVSGSTGYDYEPMHCLKISYNLGEERVVIRGCQSRGLGRINDHRHGCRLLDDYARNQPDTYVNYCDVCERDGCNSSAKTSIAWTLALMMMMIVCFVNRR